MRTIATTCGLIWITSAVALAGQQPAKDPARVVSETLAAQVMLDRSGFSPGEIDGRAGPNFKRALTAFQRAQKLTESGQLDAPTWTALSERAGNVPPLVSYEITAQDVAGPFTPDIPADLVEQSKLSALGYKNAAEAIAEKFHASPTLLKTLNRGATFDRAGEQITVPNVTMSDPIAFTAAPEPKPVATSGEKPARGAKPGARDAAAAKSNTAKPAAEPKPDVTIVVTKETSSLTVEDASGTVLFHAPVTSGSEHDPLPIGEWKVTTVKRNPPFNYNPDLFWDADPKHSKAKIPPGPNNPVGVVWIDLSKEHYGIHGSPEPSRIGHTQSHGCVRLTNWDAMKVTEWARPGTKVVFR